jgi:hypothetical protein
MLYLENCMLPTDLDMQMAVNSNEQQSGPFFSLNLRTPHRILCQKGRKNTVQTNVNCSPEVLIQLLLSGTVGLAKLTVVNAA